MMSLSRVWGGESGDRCQRRAHFPREEEIEKIGFLPEQVVCWCVHIWQAVFRSLPRVWPGQAEVVIETSGESSTAAHQFQMSSDTWDMEGAEKESNQHPALEEPRVEAELMSWYSYPGGRGREPIQVQADISSLDSLWPYQALSMLYCTLFFCFLSGCPGSCSHG